MGSEKESKVIIKDFDDILGNLSLPLLLNVNAKGADSLRAMSQQNRSDQLSMSSRILQHHIALVFPDHVGGWGRYQFSLLVISLPFAFLLAYAGYTPVLGRDSTQF